MKTALRSEAILQMVLVIFVYFYIFNYNWVFLLVFLLVPDLSILGYIFNTKIGAYCYNTVHNLIVPAALFMFSYAFKFEIGIMLTLILFAHVLMDRGLGYGLKYTDSFKHTHIS